MPAGASHVGGRGGLICQRACLPTERRGGIQNNIFIKLWIWEEGGVVYKGGSGGYGVTL